MGMSYITNRSIAFSTSGFYTIEQSAQAMKEFAKELELLKSANEKHTFKCKKNDKIKGRHAKPFYSKDRW